MKRQLDCFAASKPLQNSQIHAFVWASPKTGKLKDHDYDSRIVQHKYAVVVCCFLATMCAYVERTTFSMAFTTMAQHSATNEAVKGMVFASFYWGYMLSQVPGGWAAQRYGGRRILMLCFATWSTLCMLTPSSAQHVGAIVAARVLVGVSQGFLIPSVHTLLAQWVPAEQRAKATSLTTSGMYLGSALATVAMPSFAAAYGAATLLKLVAAMGFAWLLLWCAVSRDGSAHQPSIPTVTAAGVPKPSRQARPPARATPWLQMCSSAAVWAIVINNFAFHYAFYIVMNWMPTYFNAVLHTDLSLLGPVKAAPYVGIFFTSNAGGWFGDWLINHRHFSVALARKTVNTLGFWATAGALVMMAVSRSVSSGVLWTACALSACGFARGGFSVNHMDIAPRYAGALMGISNTAGTVAGIVGVQTSGWLLQHAGGSTALSGWYYCFCHSAVVCVLGSLSFMLFARGERLFGT